MNSATPSLWWDLAKAFVMLVLVLPLAYLATRLYAVRSGAKRSHLVRVVDMAPLGAGKFLCVVAFGGRLLLLGVTAQSVTLLAELAAADAASASESREQREEAPSFVKLLKGRLAREAGEQGVEDR